MALTSTQRELLLQKLANRGWRIVENSIKAPNGGMFLPTDSPWHNDIHDFHARMAGRLQRIKDGGNIHETEEEYQAVIDNTAGIVDAIQEIIDTEKEE